MMFIDENDDDGHDDDGADSHDVDDLGRTPALEVILT